MTVKKANLNTKNRTLHLEPLEARQLLSVNVASAPADPLANFADDTPQTVAPAVMADAQDIVDLSLLDTSPQAEDLPVALEAVQEPVKYIDVEGKEQTLTEAYTVVDESITGKWGETGEETWYVVNSTVSMTDAAVRCYGKVNLILADGGSLTVTGMDDMAGINVSDSNSLTIYGQAEGTGTLNASGGAYGAGIGGNSDQDGYNITINGGTVVAKGTVGGAGIGGGYTQDESAGKGYNISINGGNVTATGDGGGAGIGNGDGAKGDASDIFINGKCVVKAGADAASASTITHTSEEDLAGTLKTYAYVKSAAPVKVSVTYIDANGEEKTEKATVVDESMTGTWDAGWYVVNSTVSMYNFTCSGAVNLILADGGSLTVTGKYGYAGINVSGEGNSLAIYGQAEGTGILHVTGGNSGAGIGGGSQQSGSNITIYGGTIYAEGGNGGAGIGGGREQSGSNITINGGTVTALGGQFGLNRAAGIGNGVTASTLASNIKIDAKCIVKAGEDEASAVPVKPVSGDDWASTLAGKAYVYSVPYVPVEYEVKSEQELNDTLAKVLPGDTIKLTDDIELSAAMNVTEAMDITLDLNGYTLEAKATEENKFSVITIAENGTLTISDSSETQTGKITGGLGTGYSFGPDTIYVGGGIDNNGTLTITGGNITGNSASGSGGGIDNKGTLTMTGGNITDNSTENDGGGISNILGKVTLLGGNITGNSAVNYDGGGIKNMGTLVLGGNVVVSDNTMGESDGNIYLGDGETCVITLSTEKPLEEGANIGVAMQDVTGTFATNATANDAQYFTADADDKAVVYDSANECLKLVTNWTVTSDADSGEGSLRDVLTKADAGDVITFAESVKEIKLASTLTITKAVTIDGGEDGVILKGDGVNNVQLAWINGVSGATLQNLTFRDANATNTAGALAVWGSTDIVLTNCKFLNNASTGIGAALDCLNSTVTVNNGLFAGNKCTADNMYGTIFVYADNIDASLIMNNCTITDNSVTGTGSAIYAVDRDGVFTVTLNNCIVVGNTGGKEIYAVKKKANSTFVTNNVLGTAANWEGVTTQTGTVEYDNTQLFKNAAKGDYSLAKDSQAIDKGDNALVPAALTTDLDGNERIYNDTVDLGCYEFAPVANELRITQDEKYVVFTMLYDIDEAATYTLTIKAGYVKKWRKPVTLEKVTLEDGTTALRAEIKKGNFLTTYRLGYDYKVEQVGESEPLVEGNFVVKSQATPNVKYKATGVNSFTMTFKGEIDEARTILNARVKNDRTWSEWYGETSLADLIEQGIATELGDGVYEFDFTEMQDVDPGAKFQVKVYYASNVVVNELDNLEDNEGTLLLESSVSTKSVTLKQPEKLAKISATVKATASNLLTVTLKKVDSRTEEIYYLVKVGDSVYEGSYTYTPGDTSFDITTDELPTNTKVQVRLWETAPNNIEVTDSNVTTISCKTPKTF